MSRRGLLIGAVVVVALAVIAAWVAGHTHWQETKVFTPLRGEARTNPFYAMEKLVTRLGGSTLREAFFIPPPVGDIVYVANWNWDLAEGRRRTLEQWVESGGRLVMDDSVYWYDEEHFTGWSGIRYQEVKMDQEERKKRARRLRDDECMLLSPRGDPFVVASPPDRGYTVCTLDPWMVLETTRPVSWGMGDAAGLRALRVPVGRGSLTLLLSAAPFTWRNLLQEDQAALFVGATQLRAGDRLHLLTEADYPSLPALSWRFGWPVLVLGLLALLLALWRNGARFGPLVPAAEPMRRSLAEQIRGVGRFALRFGGAAALHAASRRALEHAGRQRIPGFDTLRGDARAAALAAAAGIEAPDLSLALHPPDAAGRRHLVAAIVQLETVRRRMLSQPTRHIHGS